MEFGELSQESVTDIVNGADFAKLNDALGNVKYDFNLADQKVKIAEFGKYYVDSLESFYDLSSGRASMGATKLAEMYDSLITLSSNFAEAIDFPRYGGW